MDAFGLMGFMFGMMGFVYALNALSKVGKLEARLKTSGLLDDDE